MREDASASSERTIVGALAGQPLQDRRVRARGGLVGRDHQATGIRNLLAHFAQAAVRRAQHGRDPLPLRIERRPPRLRGDVLRVVLAELRLHLVARAGAPAHLPGVDEEHHGPDDAVGERSAVAVAVIGAREADAVLVGVVLDERDRRGVAAERGSRQQQAPRRAAVGLAQRVAPAERVAAVVHFVEDDEGAGIAGQSLVDGGLHGDLGVGHRDAVILPRGREVAVAEGGVESDRHARGGIGPLGLQVLGGRDDDDAVDDAPTQQLGRQTQRERRLSGARRRRGQEVARTPADAVRTLETEVAVERLGLPGAQPVGGAPRRALRVRR